MDQEEPEAAVTVGGQQQHQQRTSRRGTQISRMVYCAGCHRVFPHIRRGKASEALLYRVMPMDQPVKQFYCDPFCYPQWRTLRVGDVVSWYRKHENLLPPVNPAVLAKAALQTPRAPLSDFVQLREEEDDENEEQEDDASIIP
jgi:hypothetical protein